MVHCTVEDALLYESYVKYGYGKKCKGKFHHNRHL
jgi:hypothetical protein